jgi:hypothetical protein
MATKRKASKARRDPDEAPVMMFRFTNGSNNGTRATVRVYRYQNGQICLQIEDMSSGGEIWFKNLVTMYDFLDKLGAAVCH